MHYIYIYIYIVNRNKKHPLDESRPLIYWDIALLLIPPQLGGNNVGAVLAKIFPDSATMILAMVVTFYAVYLTYNKGLYLYKLETDAVEHYRANSSAGTGTGIADGDDLSTKLLGDVDEERNRNSENSEKVNNGIVSAEEGNLPMRKTSSFRSTRTTSNVSTSTNPMLSDNAQHMAYVEATHSQHGWLNPQVVVLEDKDGSGSVAIVIDESDGMDRTESHQSQSQSRTLSVASNASKHSVLSVSGSLIHEASKHGQTVTNSEDRVDIVIPVFSLGLLLLSLVFFVCVNISMTLTPKCSTLYWVFLACSYPVLIGFIYYIIEHLSGIQTSHPDSVLYGDVNITQDKVSRPIMSFMIGITCSLLGLGGGELFGPFLLSMKVLPQVSSATTSIMSMISSCNNIIHHMATGSIPYEAAGILFLVGALGGSTGRIGALHITKLFGRPSLLIFILAVILSASGCILIGEFIVKKPDFELSNVCS